MDKAKDILTKYWVGILCGVIALVAIIASFIPLGSYHDELKQKLQGSAGTHTQIDQLMNQSRLKPKLLDEPEQKELGMFPSASVIDSGKKLVDKLEEESKNAMSRVVTINRHEQLLRGVLPQPMGNAPFDFRAAYIKRLAGLEGTLASETLKAVMPPTNEQIIAEEKRKWTQEFANRLIPDATGQGKALNQDQVEADFQTARALLPGQMRESAAKAGKIYMAPGVLGMDPIVANKIGPQPPTPIIWWSQMALWVQEDVANAIAHANRDATNVTNSRVKRLLALNVPISSSMIFGKTMTVPGSGMGGPEAAAPIAPSNPNEPVVLDYKGTPTGRTSNALYDVVQYQVEMVVAAKELPAVLTSFSDNRLVTVLNVESMIAEDSTVAAREGFMYGADPVVRVVFRCESLFLREWTVPMMPDVIKKMMGIAPPPAPGT
jgi:hypothetical protein